MSDETGRERETETIEVDPGVFERFEQKRMATQTESVPAMDRSTFLSMLLDTLDVVRDDGDAGGDGGGGWPVADGGRPPEVSVCEECGGRYGAPCVEELDGVLIEECPDCRAELSQESAGSHAARSVAQLAMAEDEEVDGQ